jgi:fermentation-respiration switch protein FrsA (DUF1100 family)
MMEMKTVIIVLAVLVVLVLLTSYICYRIAFYVPRKPTDASEVPLPKGRIYEPYYPQMRRWLAELQDISREEMTITSFDGLQLFGRFYEFAPGAPVELMVHGYRGTAEGDLCGGVQRCFSLGRSVLLIDQRTSGRSEGHTITFGVNESRDCLSWLDYMTKRFGEDQKIILTGISMGAATVMMATTYDLPKNVVGILADCGYTSAEAIIKKVMRSMKLPVPLLYPFIKLGARIYGHFDLEENPPIEAMKKCTLPIVFVHGDADDFVPHEMSARLYKECASEKKLLITVPGAGHGLAYPVDRKGYVDRLNAIYKEWQL